MSKNEQKDPKSLPVPFNTGPLKWPDMTANERHIARSIKIRRKVLAFLDMHVGEVYLDYADLANQTGNYCECSAECARRWLYQFTAPGTPYILKEQGAGLVIWRRESTK